MIDVHIVGAGPAGLSAAIVCASRRLNVVVADEFVRPGGRLSGQLHEHPRGVWHKGGEEAARLTERALSAGVRIESGVSVADIRRTGEEWTLLTDRGEWRSPCVLLATGAAETSFALPGWTLPGVMTVGAAQVMTQVHRVRIGRRGAIVGVNALSMAILRELRLAGIELASVLLPPRNATTGAAWEPREALRMLGGLSVFAPAAWMRLGGKALRFPALRRLAAYGYPPAGLSLWGVPLQLRSCALEIVGRGQVEGIRIAGLSPDGSIVPGSEQWLEADFVCLSGGLHPLAELAAVAGCPFVHSRALGGHVPVHDERMRTPLAGLYVAGSITGIEGAKVAAAQGRAAGLSIANDRAGVSSDDADLLRAMEEVREARRAAPLHFQQGIEQARAAFYRENGIRHRTNG